MESFKDFLDLQESSLTRIWDKTQKHSCGTFTTFRADRTRQENLANNREAERYLVGRGYSVTKIKGSYIENFKSDNAKEVGEASFFIANHKVNGDDGGELKKDLVALGRKYDQDSVLIIPFGGEGAYLFGTSKRGNGFPPYNQKEVVGKGGYGDAAGEFFSRIRGRKFAFEDVQTPQTINGIRGQKIFVEKFSKELDFSE